MNGITGPLEVFEGDKGFMDAIAGVFDIDWLREDLDRVKRTILKRFNAEIHSQAAIQGVLDLKARTTFLPPTWNGSRSKPSMWPSISSAEEKRAIRQIL